MAGYGVIVHAGAGYHSQSKKEQYELICQTACRKAINCLKNGKPAYEAVLEALQYLEDSPLTNAGLGSTLNIDGQVECDACLACSRSGCFGGVGAVTGIRYPSAVATDLLRQQIENPTLELGRIPPSVLVGDGAYRWATERGHTVASSDSLITKESYSSYCKYKRRLNQYQQKMGLSNEHPKKRPHSISLETTERKRITKELTSRLDTIGVVCLDIDGRVVSGASSGGIALKFPGRVGQVCILGAGCWAEERDEPKEAIGVATSGTGEHLMRTLLAKRVAESCFDTEDVPVESLNRCMKNDFLSARSLSNITEKSAGAIVLRTHAAVNGYFPMIEFLYAHTTPSMSIGYMSSKCKKPTVFISRTDAPTVHGVTAKDSITSGGKVIKF